MGERYLPARTAASLPLTAMLAALALTITQTAHAQVCPFDDGNSSLAVEGVILTR